MKTSLETGCRKRSFALVAFGLALWMGWAAAPADALAQSSRTGGRAADRSDDGLSLAYRYITVGWIDWAALHLADVADAQPQPEPLVLLGMVYQSLGEKEQALQAYLKGAQAAEDPRAKSAALTFAANVLFDLGRFDEAKARFTEALGLVPGNAQAMYGLGRLADREENRDEALGWYVRAADASAEWIEPFLRASILHNGAGRFGEALKLLKRAESLGTWNADFHYQLARSYEGLMRQALAGELSEAELKELVGVEIPSGGAASRLRELAVHAAHRALQLAPFHAAAEKLLARLTSTP